MRCRSMCLTFVTDVPKTIQSEMKDIFDADTEENIFKTNILTKRDKVAVNGEYGISSSSANPRSLVSPRLAPFW